MYIYIYTYIRRYYNIYTYILYIHIYITYIYIRTYYITNYTPYVTCTPEVILETNYREIISLGLRQMWLNTFLYLEFNILSIYNKKNIWLINI